MSLSDCVASSNDLTRAWIGELDAGKSLVASGAGVWLLLNALLTGASGDAQQELAAALNMQPDRAADAVETMLQAIRETSGAKEGLGVWASKRAKVRPSYANALPSAHVGSMQSTEEMDRWVRERTNGMIQGFSEDITDETLLIAASALAVEADWTHPFDENSGRWNGSQGRIGFLYRQSQDLSGVQLVSHGDTVISRAICETTGGFDVHLLAGSPSNGPNDVFAAGFAALAGDAQVVAGNDLDVGDSGGCLQVVERGGFETEPYVRLGVPGFEIETRHELLEKADFFGLVAAQDDSRGHFAGISDYPLAIEKAFQVAMAGFSATGFRAGALSVAMMRGGAAPPSTTERVIEILHNRPFGFVVVERSTRLVLFAGWVETPVQTLVEEGMHG